MTQPTRARHARIVDPDRVTRALRRTTDRAERRRRALPEPQVLITAPGFEFAAGDRHRRFHSASVGKMMTATLAFDLAERGLLDLEAPLAALVPASDYTGLFENDGQDAAPPVTPMHLLTHTSGVADYFEGVNDTRESFIDRVTQNPDVRFTPADLVDYSRAHQRPVGRPGEQFHYSDTGYVLLGRVIEEAGRASLGEQLHRRIFGPAGMDASCLMFHTLPGARHPINPIPAKCSTSRRSSSTGWISAVRRASAAIGAVGESSPPSTTSTGSPRRGTPAH